MRNKIKILCIVMMFLLVSSINYVLAQERDSDLDGVPDLEDRYPFDYDNDGMPDIWEKKNGLRYDISNADEDTDNDGIKNIDEYKQGTNPLVSDKTQERVPQELLTPVEKTMARGLIWIGVGLFLFILVVFILYRVHIFRVFKFMHHVSREHFDEHAREHFRGRRSYGRRPVYGRGVLPPQRFSAYPGRVYVRRPIRREVLRPRVREYVEAETIERVEKPRAEERAKEESSGYEEKKDVFERLSKQVHEHNKVKNKIV